MSEPLVMDLAAATKDFASQVSKSESVSGINPEVIQPIDSDIEVQDSNFWTKDEDTFKDVKGSFEQESKPVAKKQEAAKSGLLTYKANGKEVQLDFNNPEHLAQIQKRMSEADGMSKAFAKAAKAEQRTKELDAELTESRKYKDSWDKLEGLRHDKAKLLELIVGEPYEEFIKKESDKRQIMEMGTEEEKQLVRQQGRIGELEERLKLFEESTNKQARETEARTTAAKEAEESAKNEQFKATLEREFFKHVDDSIPDDLKQFVYQKTVLDLKKMYEKYGQITNKMVSKAMSNNANRLKSYKTEAVNTEVNKAIHDKKQDATTKAQEASTKNYEPDVEGINLSSLSPDKLFKYLQFKNKRPS